MDFFFLELAAQVCCKAWTNYMKNLYWLVLLKFCTHYFSELSWKLFLLMTGPLDFYNISWEKVQDMPNDATLLALLRVTCLTAFRSLRCTAKVFWMLHKLPPLVHSTKNTFLVTSVFLKFPSSRLKLKETNDDHISLINSVRSRLCLS